MNRFEAFHTLYESEGNAQRAALLLSYAFVVKLAGWEALNVSSGKRNGIRASFARAGIEPHMIEFYTDGVDTLANMRETLTKKQIEEKRLEEVREFGMLAANMHGRVYKKTRRMEKHLHKNP